MKIGFTGTSWGMTEWQKEQVRQQLLYWQSQGATELHHGLCIGADEQAAVIAHALGYRVVAHPGYSPKNPDNTMYRSDFTGSDETREAKPFIARDRDIVDETDRMVAAPRSQQEETRSGTWTTVRYARKKKREIDMVYP